MNDLISKISSYDLFNNLVPGAIFAFMLNLLDLFHLPASSVVVDLVFYYFLGLIVSRIGSIILDPVLHAVGLLKKPDYNDFIRASERDPKIAVLLESRNLFRTVLSLVLVTLVAYVYKHTAPSLALSPVSQNIILLVALAALFLFAYLKQSGFIERRVTHHSQTKLDHTS